MKKFWSFFIFLSIISFVACNKNPYASTNKVYKKQAKKLSKDLRMEPPLFDNDSIKPAYWVGTTNFNLRKPNFVIIHHTAQNSCEQTLKTFTLERTQVSAHYVICKDGKIHHMLNDYLRAWHGGSAKWGSNTDINSASIGIELDNNGFEPFSDVQMLSLELLLDTLKRKYNIPKANFIGHGDIAPTRKNDPNVFFPWQSFAKKGFGLWYDEKLDSVPPGFNTLQALRIVGYDIKDSSAAIGAFKRHFLGVEKSSPILNKEEKKILYNLMKKAL